MTYSTACETLGLTTPKGLVKNARIAKSMLSGMCQSTPLRFKVAANLIVKAA